MEPQSPSNSPQWPQLLLPLLMDRFAESPAVDDAGLAALFPVALDPRQPVQLTVLATQLCRGQKNCTAASMAGAMDEALGRFYPCRSIFSGGRILTLAATQEDFQRLEPALDQVQDTLGRELGLQCRMGVSRTVTTAADCHRACREAIDAQRFAEGNGVHFITALLSGAQAPARDLATVDSTLEGLIRGGSQAELNKYLTDLFAAASAGGALSLEIATVQVAAVVLRILQNAMPQGQMEVLLRQCGIPLPLFQGMDPDLRCRCLIRLCHGAQELPSAQRRAGVSLLCGRAMEAIDRHYMDASFSLSSVSEHLHVSPNYLSANMKKHAGDTFINLLIKKRMTVAAELLSATSLKIMEVAHRCGYSDQHYFSFCFKKYFGMTPAQMRRSGRGKGPLPPEK